MFYEYCKPIYQDISGAECGGVSGACVEIRVLKLKIFHSRNFALSSRAGWISEIFSRDLDKLAEYRRKIFETDRNDIKWSRGHEY